MEVIAIELNEELLCLFVVFTFIFSALGESLAIWRYKRKWDKRKVEAFAEIASIIETRISSNETNKVYLFFEEYESILHEIYNISITEIKREPWFVLSRADKMLRPKRIKERGKVNE